MKFVIFCVLFLSSLNLFAEPFSQATSDATFVETFRATFEPTMKATLEASSKQTTENTRNNQNQLSKIDQAYNEELINDAIDYVATGDVTPILKAYVNGQTKNGDTRSSEDIIGELTVL